MDGHLPFMWRLRDPVTSFKIHLVLFPRELIRCLLYMIIKWSPLLAPSPEKKSMYVARILTRLLSFDVRRVRIPSDSLQCNR
ncbi:hypothetical protein A0H81_06760 [Grifola frondosa]|uniref:Uncharacterized protein n=1 Tax=Grifola frondosa TaxID=5627 RepID=A0A1C7MA81_GRIFR|nr:hypothetical protein A0H81_06760 [Grifola frondosa]